MKEILRHLVTTTVLPEDHYLDQDPEILEIFIEELEEIFQDVQPLLKQWLQQPELDDVLITIRRHFHTLKGSGRMVGATSSAELAWTVEDTLNRVIANHVQLSDTVQNYVISVFNVYQYKLFEDFKTPRSHGVDLRALVLLGQQLQQNLSLEPALVELLDLSHTLTDANMITGLEVAYDDNSDVIYVEDHLEGGEESSQASRTHITAELELFDTAIANRQHAELEKIECAKPDLQRTETGTTAVALFASSEDDLAQPLEWDHLASDTLAIFVEEAEEHLSTIEDFIQHDHHTPDQYNRLIRALHTLRGSSTMAKVDGLFEASSKVEHIFKSLIQEETENSINENGLLIHFAEYVRDSLHAIRSKTTAGVEFQMVQQHFDDVWAEYDYQVKNIHESNNVQNLLGQLLNADIGTLLDTDLEFDKRARNEYPEYLHILSDQAENLSDNSHNRAAMGIYDFSQFLKLSYDAVLDNRNLLNTEYVFELFSKAHQQFLHLFDMLAAGQRVSLSDESKLVMEELRDYLQQDIEFLDSLTNSVALPKVEKSVKSTSIDPAVIRPVDAALRIAASHDRTVESDAMSALIAKDKALIDSQQSNVEFDEDVLDIFIEEAEELLISIDQDLNTWSEDLNDKRALNNLMRHLHTLKGGANMLQAEYVGLIAHELETIYERIIKGVMPVNADLVKSIRSIQDDISDRIQMIREDHIDYPAPHILAVLHRMMEPDAEQRDPIDDISTQSNQLSATAPPASAKVKADSSELDQYQDIPVDSIALESFKEEAEELIADAFAQLTQWTDQRGNRSRLLQLQRHAHTLKGGARMAGLHHVASIAGQLETVFEQFAVHKVNSNAYDALLESAFSWLKTVILEGHHAQHVDALKAQLSKIQYIDVSAQVPDQRSPTQDLAEQYTTEFVQGDGTEPPSMLGEWNEAGNTEHNDEMIRISAGLIEKMIDLSGENAINRSRVEMDLSQLGHTLTDMELAIQRLADQLRRMEGELESQIIAKHDDMGLAYADFDPLEMDQYSSINQLSKSLAESASDLVDFKMTLAEKIKDTEGILLQQSRIQAEIQQGLMRARLVPFSRLLPRLQRLVRQVSTTLNKPTELYVNNTQGELDRTILEKLVAPLEHMLRNALDHGIESTHDRVTNNKPAMGKIELNISRQGTDILIAFKDDGRGVDANKVKAKAIDVGLIQANQQMSREDILQYIFHPGLSTADQVTQISGRGVGLDVVQSGIKSLGGEVSVSSELGQGSTFTIRVPTTVAVSDALMVKVGDQQFAIPLTQIDRIVRISSNTLDTFFNSDQDLFDIDSQSYKLRYLAEYIGCQGLPKLNGISHALPVLLIKGTMGQSIALLVDQIIGSRSQIVMKSIGNQFSAVGAVTGATILGDGNVCLILDGQYIARQVQVSNRDHAKAEQPEQQLHSERRHLIMIVDDSVTVRKVTSRLLERHGFDVITTKDGMDAIEQLETIKPDLMLLDIEMPRMDGFEVTTHVRHHQLHHDLPIVMITSRTGEKHRERAFSLGVTHYMGKPFQEASLLDSIESALATNREFE